MTCEKITKKLNVECDCPDYCVHTMLLISCAFLWNIFCNQLNSLSDAEQTYIQDPLFRALFKLTSVMALVTAKTSCQSNWINQLHKHLWRCYSPRLAHFLSLVHISCSLCQTECFLVQCVKSFMAAFQRTWLWGFIWGHNLTFSKRIERGVSYGFQAYPG